MVVAITGCYRTTANEKLLRLLRLNRLDEELMIKNAVADLNRASRHEVRETMRRAYLDEKSNGYSFDCEDDLDEIDPKYVIWCASKHGPFKTYLKRMNLAENDWCRYCHSVPETPIHLVSECDRFGFSLDTPTNIFYLDSIARNVTARLKVDNPD